MPTPEQIIFAFTRSEETPDNVPVLMFIIPEAGWDYMASGRGHNFDLTKLGIPLKVVIGRTQDHASGMELLRQANLLGKNTKDVRNIDLNFTDDKVKQ